MSIIHFTPGVIPPERASVSTTTTVTLSASTASGQAILAFGGWCFPMYPLAGHHPLLKVASRLAGVDSDSYSENIMPDGYEPPYWVCVPTYVSGDDTDAGTYRIAGSGRVYNPNNHGRYVFNTGVTGTKSGVWRLDYYLSTGNPTEYLATTDGPVLVSRTFILSLTAT